MMTKKSPQLRFEGFTDDWEERKLGDVTTWTKGQGLTKEDLNKERDGSEAVHYADLYKFSPVMHEVIHWTNSDDGQIIPDNSLLFPASDVTPVGLARTSTLRLSGVKAGGDVIIGQLDESINSSFMSYQINANSKKILPLITGTTVKHIQAKSLATVSVSITNMAEQTAIAGIFEQLDETIALHQRKLDLLKEQKKGFLQKMFPKNGAKVPELRFAGFTDAWEERKIKDIFKITRGQVLAATETSEEKSDISPFPVYSSQTKNNGLMGYYKDYLFDTAITWTTDGANAGTVSYRSGKFYSTNVNGVLISDKGYTNKAISEILNLEAWKWVSHVGNPKLMNNVMGDISIMIPSSFEEQDRLSDFLNQLDDTIALHQRKLDLLKEQKKGFLQKMFV